MSRTFLSSKRRRIGVLAASGALAVAATAAAAALPSSPPPAHVSTDADIVVGPPGVLSFFQVRSRVLHQVTELQAAQAAAAARAQAQRVRAARAHAIHEQRVKQAAAGSPSSSAVVTSGSPEQIARSMLSQFGWSAGQYSCLYPLWRQESNWSITAANPSTGAYGIPQALPGSRMASAGGDWQTDAATQIRWGLEYIQARYGSPCAAWAQEQAGGWY